LVWNRDDGGWWDKCQNIGLRWDDGGWWDKCQNIGLKWDGRWDISIISLTINNLSFFTISSHLSLFIGIFDNISIFVATFTNSIYWIVLMIWIKGERWDGGWW